MRPPSVACEQPGRKRGGSHSVSSSGGHLITTGELNEALPNGNELRHMAHEHPATGAEVGSCRLTLAEVPAVVTVASGIVQGLPSRAWLLLTYAVQVMWCVRPVRATAWAHRGSPGTYGMCLIRSHAVKDYLTTRCQVGLDGSSRVHGRNVPRQSPEHIQRRLMMACHDASGIAPHPGIQD